jgi:hypothetical protein
MLTGRTLRRCHSIGGTPQRAERQLDEAIIEAGSEAGKSERLEMGELSKPFERDVAK